MRKGFKAYNRENAFTRLVDQSESRFIQAIENDNIEKLKFNIRVALFIYTSANLLIFTFLEKHLGKTIAIHGIILTMAFIFSLLGLMPRGVFHQTCFDLKKSLIQATKWLVRVLLFICIAYFTFEDWCFHHYGKSFDEGMLYLWYPILFLGILYLLLLLVVLAIYLVSATNYHFGNLLVKGLKSFLAHCRRHQREDPLQIMTFWSETVVSTGSFLWMIIWHQTTIL